MSKNLLVGAKIMAIAAGLIVVIVGGIASIIYAIIMIFAPETRTIDTAVGSLAFVVLGAGVGGALAWHSGRSLYQKKSAPFQLPPFWLSIISYVIFLIVGQALLYFEIWPLITFPPVHILMAALPSLTVLAFVSGVLRSVGFYWRDMAVQLFNGSILAMIVAFTIEIFFIIALIVLLIGVMAFTSDGMSMLEEIITNVENPLWLENPENILTLLSFPPVSITLVVVFIVIAPLAEEFFKPFGVALMSYRRPSRARAFVWGVTGGAGFAITENIFNSLWGLDTWSVVMLVRVGATLMHCLTGGIVALGIHQLLIQRRPLGFFGAYGLSVVIHAVWNTTAVIIIVISTFVMGQGANPMFASVAGIIMLFLVGFLLTLFVAIVVGLVMLTYRLRPQATPAVTEAAT